MDSGRDNPLGARPELWLSKDGTVLIPVRGISMGPTLVEGDRVEVRRASREEVVPGDLVVFPRAGALTVHRLLRLRRDRFLEMGDGQGRGNWQPWPPAVGLVLAVDGSDGVWRDLRTPEARGEAAGQTRRLLRRHRANSLAQLLPGSFPRRLFLRLLRPWIS